MWIVYLLSFITGIFIAKLVDGLSEVISERNKYTASEFKDKAGTRIAGLAFLSIIAAALITIATALALSNEINDQKDRVESLENKVERLESLNQVDTIVIRKFIDEEDLK